MDTTWFAYVNRRSSFLLFLSYPSPSTSQTHVVMHLGNITILYPNLCAEFCMLFDITLLDSILYPRASLWIHLEDYAQLSPILSCLLYLKVMLLKQSLCLLCPLPPPDQTKVVQYELIGKFCDKIWALRYVCNYKVYWCTEFVMVWFCALIQFLYFAFKPLMLPEWCRLFFLLEFEVSLMASSIVVG